MGRNFASKRQRYSRNRHGGVEGEDVSLTKVQHLQLARLVRFMVVGRLTCLKIWPEILRITVVRPDALYGMAYLGVRLAMLLGLLPHRRCIKYYAILWVRWSNNELSPSHLPLKWIPSSSADWTKFDHAASTYILFRIQCQRLMQRCTPHDDQLG